MKLENIFEKIIMGGFLVVIIGFIIIWFGTVGSELIKIFGIWGLLLIPLGFGIVICIGWLFKLIFPHATIYKKEEE